MRPRPSQHAAAVAACFIACCPLAVGGITEWIGPDGGLFDAPRNWSDGVPGAGDTAFFGIAGAYTVLVPTASVANRVLVRDGDLSLAVMAALDTLSPSPFAPSITVADTLSSSASLTIPHGILTGGHTLVGGGFFSDGVLSIGADATLLLDGVLGVGSLGHGTLLVAGEIVAPALQSGVLDSGVGTIVIDGGFVELDLALTVGSFGASALSIVDGAVVAGLATVALNREAGAAVTVAGPNSSLVVVDRLIVGDGGHGTLTVTDGAQVEVGNDLRLGILPPTLGGFPFFGPGTGVVEVDGTGSLVAVAGDARCGVLGVGEIALSRGGRMVVDGDLYLNVGGGLVATLRFTVARADAGDFASPAVSMLDVGGDAGTNITVMSSYNLLIELDPDDPPGAGDAYILIEADVLKESNPVALPTIPGLVAQLFTETVDGRERQILRFGSAFDLTGDGIVDGADLGALLTQWGECPGGSEGCPADFDGDGVVDGADLGLLLANWTSPARGG